METFDVNTHWENIYANKSMTEVSWYQKKPEVSLEYLQKLNIPKSARIIDVGGGDSFFVDFLFESGYDDVTVLDISQNAIDRAKKRLGKQAGKVNWIVADASDFKTDQKFDFWHDRAAFHFLKDESAIGQYKQNLINYLDDDGQAVIATFSKNGPTKCSGIEISQYSEDTLTDCFSSLQKIDCKIHLHQTPFATTQEFVFCAFKKQSS